MIKTCGECFFFNDGEPLSEGQHKAPCHEQLDTSRIHRREDESASCYFVKKSTLEPLYFDLMRGHTVATTFCVVCGRSGGVLNQHHVVKRSQGKLYDKNMKEKKKPTLTLCGSGNTSGCHGKAHSGQLYFRWVGEWQYLETEACSYLEALDREGWKPIYF